MMTLKGAWNMGRRKYFCYLLINAIIVLVWLAIGHPWGVLGQATVGLIATLMSAKKLWRGG